MVDGSLTQQEIDMLLQGADDFHTGAVETGAAQGGGSSRDMSPLERETVADMVHQALQSGSQGLGLILSKNVKLGAPYAEVKSQEEIDREFSNNYVLFSQQCSGAFSGTLSLLLAASEASKISAIVMGHDDAPAATTLDSAQIATVKDALGPLLFSVANQISVRIGSAVTPMPVDVKVLTPPSAFPVQESAAYLRIQFPFNVEGTVDSRLTMVMPLPIAQDIYRRSKGQAEQGGMGFAGGGGAVAQAGPRPGQTGVKEVNFPQLSMGGPGPMQPNMNLLMDVQMTLTVELGRTKMYIKEILRLGEGSIIELDKLAGEPVDLLVNGKLIAKGEVVVIDENFGVRVTDIVSPIDRLKGPKQG